MTKQQQRVLRAARSVVAAWAREGLATRRFSSGGELVDRMFALARAAEQDLINAVEELRGREP